MAGHRSWKTLRVLLLAVAVGTLVAIGTGCGERDVERTLGDMSRASIESAYNVDDDPLINEWLKHAGQTLVGHSRRQDIPYSFRVIETDQVNAFAAPFGHIYVTRGFLDFVETEDEVWMVLGHEIGHIVNRDSITSFKQNLLWGILSQVIRGESEAIGDVVGLGLGLLSLQYSRDDEYRADDSGTMLSYSAGYDPHLGLRFFERLAEQRGRRPSRWEVYFMTHPPLERRMERQLERPEFDLSNVETLVQVGRGYLLRGQPARAAELMKKTIEIDPQLALAHGLLGDAHAMRGEIAAAERAYQTALELGDERDYARTRLAALSEMEETDLPGIDPDGRSIAKTLLAELGEARTMTESLRADSQRLRGTAESRIDSLAANVVGINNSLHDLANYQGDVSRATQQLVIRGNAAISQATEAAYVLEAVNESLQRDSAELDDLLVECEAVLTDAEAGQGRPEDVPALRTAVQEIKLAVGMLEEVTSEVPGTLSEVEAAQDAAAEVTSAMDIVARRNESTGMFADQLRSAASRAEQFGADALEAVGRAQDRSMQARGHALVARLNLLGTTASPALQSVYDAQVSHLLLVPEGRVKALRATGAGYGETAMALAASRSAHTGPEPYLPSLASGISPVTEAVKRNARVGNANVLLKLLAASMEAEREAEATL